MRTREDKEGKKGRKRRERKKSGKYDGREEVKGKIKEQVWRKGKVLMNLQVKYG